MAAMYAEAPELRRITLFDEARPRDLRGGHGRRLDAVRAAAHAFHGELAAGPRVVAVRSLTRSRLVYPTRYAFQGAALSPAPFVVMVHRTLLVQFLQAGELKTLLFNPTDVEGSKRTPFFVRLLEKLPPQAVTLLAPPEPSLEAQLAGHGVRPEDVDYLAFDHFHTQDVRGLGAQFPRAKLLAPRCEWEDWHRLHPMQAAWFVPDGRDGVDESKVVLTEADLSLGDGVALVRTPGHTSGNQTLFVATEHGIWGCSENATSVDSYAPLDSRIAGLARHARTYDVDLIMNLNTPEYGAEQYTSMVLERLVVDRVPHAPAFPQMFPSSEVTPSPLAPGLSPTLVFGSLTAGQVVTRGPARHAPAA